MGLKVTPSGVSIQFCKDDGLPDGPPFYSTHVKLFGLPREQVLRGSEPSPEERKFPGSDDWLTFVAIADTEEKLETIVRDSCAPKGEAFTSGSSRRVCLEMSFGGFRQMFKGRVAIASGPIIQLEPPIVHVVHIKVLPEGSRMDDGHPLLPEFIGNSPLASR